MMNQNNDNFPEKDDEGININADENLSGTEHLTDPIEETNLNTLESELTESKDKYLRLAAEFDNFRKRTAKERIETFQTAGRDIIADLLDVQDDIDRASKEIDHSKDKHLKEGINLIFNKFKNILKSKGVKPMDAVGKEFDPELYEAIAEVPVEDEKMKGRVVDEISKGYYLNDKIIRHAKVVVGK